MQHKCYFLIDYVKINVVVKNKKQKTFITVMSLLVNRLLISIIDIFGRWDQLVINFDPFPKA